MAVKSKTIDETRDLIEDKNREIDEFERDLDSILQYETAIRKELGDGHMMVQEESSEEEPVDLQPRPKIQKIPMIIREQS